MNKFKVAIAFKYTGYIPIHIKIRVLLTPGTTTPMDIKKPETTKNNVE